MGSALLVMLLWAAPGQDLVHQGISLYERGDYRGARAKLAEAMALEQLDPRELSPARLYWAASCLVLGDEPSARRALTLLVQDAPDFPVDPVLFPGRLIELMEEVRRARAAAANLKPKPPPPQAAPLERAEVPPTATAPAPPPAPAWKALTRWAPGVVGLLALGAGTYFLFQAQREVAALHESRAALSPSGALQARDRGLSDERWGYPLLAGGLAGVASTGVLLWVAPSAHGPSAAGAGVAGRFP